MSFSSTNASKNSARMAPFVAYEPMAGEGRQFVDFQISDAFGDSWQNEYEVDYMGKTIKVVKPSKVMTTRADIRRINDKSNAQLQWVFNVINPAIATPDEVPKGPWKHTLSDVTFYNHQHMTPLELVRFSTGSQACSGSDGNNCGNRRCGNNSLSCADGGKVSSESCSVSC